MKDLYQSFYTLKTKLRSFEEDKLSVHSKDILILDFDITDLNERGKLKRQRYNHLKVSYVKSGLLICLLVETQRVV